MTFNALETSLESGQIVELYQFQLGAEEFLFTSAQDDFTINAPDPFVGTYEAIAIQRSALIRSANEQRADRIEVTLPADQELVIKYISIVPGQKAVLTIARIHRTDVDEETITAFKGVVQTVEFTDNGRLARMQVVPATRAKSRETPRFTFQNLCNHMLYDERCKLDENDAAFSFNFTATAVAGSIITVPGAGAVTVGIASGDVFEAGFVEFDDDFRLVIAQSGDDLTLLLPFIDSPLTQTVRCVVGCKHRVTEDCDNRFSNTINFGGFPHIPQKNPFVTGLD